jgi:hypothetical protein
MYDVSDEFIYDCIVIRGNEIILIHVQQLHTVMTSWSALFRYDDVVCGTIHVESSS